MTNQAGRVVGVEHHTSALDDAGDDPVNVGKEVKEETPPPPPPPPPPAPESQLPVGTVVSKLPGGCVSTPVDNVQYYKCGANYYRAVYQENNLVYVTTDPPQ